MLSPKNKVVLITGASTGLGKATAQTLASRGFHVLAGVRSNHAARDIESIQLKRLEPVILDVTRSTHIDTVNKKIKQCEQNGLSLWAVVNNAGICVNAPLESVEPAQLRQQFDVNVFGAITLIQSLLPVLISNKGRIINISSGVASVAPPFLGPYAASKAALQTLTDVLRREVRQFGVGVSSVIPGAIMTPVWDKMADDIYRHVCSMTPEQKLRYEDALLSFSTMNARTAKESRVTPDAMAQIVYTSLTAVKPKPRYIVGADARAGLMLSRLVPPGLIDKIFSKIIARGQRLSSP